MASTLRPATRGSILPGVHEDTPGANEPGPCVATIGSPDAPGSHAPRSTARLKAPSGSRCGRVTRRGRGRPVYSASNADTSSANVLSPCVARTSVPDAACTARSAAGTVGRPTESDDQVAPRSRDT